MNRRTQRHILVTKLQTIRTRVNLNEKPRSISKPRNNSNKQARSPLNESNLISITKTENNSGKTRIVSSFPNSKERNQTLLLLSSSNREIQP